MRHEVKNALKPHNSFFLPSIHTNSWCPASSQFLNTTKQHCTLTNAEFPPPLQKGCHPSCVTCKIAACIPILIHDVDLSFHFSLWDNNVPLKHLNNASWLNDVLLSVPPVLLFACGPPVKKQYAAAESSVLGGAM